MNTKKAHEARASLGRCLKSTKFHPDVRNEEKKTRYLRKTVTKRIIANQHFSLFLRIHMPIIHPLNFYRFLNHSIYHSIGLALNYPKYRARVLLYISDPLACRKQNSLSLSFFLFFPRRYEHGPDRDIRVWARYKHN